MNVSAELLQRLSEEFDQVTAERHNAGAQEYGELGFLGNDLVQYALEEVADLANYARFLYIRIRILQEVARERGLDLSASLLKEGGDVNSVSYGPAAFSTSEEVSGFLPDQK